MDDEPALLRGLKRVLGVRRAGYEIVCAHSGAEALERLKNEAFDVLVTDLQMPEMNGVTLLRMVKARHARMVRVVHSSHIETVGRDHVEALADRILVKPARPEELIEALDWALSVQNAGAARG